MPDIYWGLTMDGGLKQYDILITSINKEGSVFENLRIIEINSTYRS